MSKNLSIAYAVKRKAKKMASGGEVKKPQQSDSFAEKMKQGMSGVFNSGGIVGKIMAKRKLNMDQDEELMSDEMDPMSDDEMEMMSDGGEIQKKPSPSPSPYSEGGKQIKDSYDKSINEGVVEKFKRAFSGQNESEGGMIEKKKLRLKKIMER